MMKFRIKSGVKFTLNLHLNNMNDTEIHGLVEDQVRSQVWNQVWNQVRSQVRRQISDQVYTQLTSE